MARRVENDSYGGERGCRHREYKCREQYKFFACLSGDNEVPPIDTCTTGKFKAELCRHAILYELSVCDINNLTQAHIHLGGSDENGPVVAFLYASGEEITENPSDYITFFVRKGAITQSDLVGPLKGRSLCSLLKEMKDGNAYVNVHTSTNPAGEVRGQIESYKSKAYKYKPPSDH